MPVFARLAPLVPVDAVHTRRLSLGGFGVGVGSLSVAVVISSFLIACTLTEGRATGDFSNPGSPVPTGVSGSMQELHESGIVLERRGSYELGMGLQASSEFEARGDYFNAVLEAYKDLLYGYQYGMVEQGDIQDRLDSLAQAMDGPSYDPGRSALELVRAHVRGDWEGLAGLLSIELLPGEAYDSFRRYLAVLGNLQAKGPGNTELYELWSIFQLRYGKLPEYWLYDAQVSGDEGLQRDSAFRVISLSPQGPMALQARSILLSALGLELQDPKGLLIGFEVDSLVGGVVQDPEANAPQLKGLFPLLGLPDNPFTLYALGVCRSLAQEPRLKSWFVQEAANAQGRLKERLGYVVSL